MFNDQMESKAISGTGLSDLPLTACKGIYGHTFGAAGLIEAILSMESVDDGTVLPVCGFEEIGVSGKINISNVARSTDRESFIKLQSGFGGCNAVMLYSKAPFTRKEPKSPVAVEELCSIKLNPERLEIDGRTEMLAADSDKTFVTEIYKARLSDNARFYKMDLFSRMVYVATGLLVKDRIADVLPESVSMILFNRSSSIVADRHHISTYCKKEEFYPSPSVFINTLPNVVMGEIAAKYMIKGETTFIILPDRNCEQIDRIVSSSIAASDETMMVTGWVDCTDDGKYEADLKLIKIQR